MPPVDPSRNLPPTVRPVLLFDGECGLCRSVIARLAARDPGGNLHYAPLQSEPAQSYLARHRLPTRDFESLVFVPDWNSPGRTDFKLKSDGALAAFATVGSLPFILRWYALLPRFLRDALYRIVARTRRFLRFPSVELTRPEWTDRFVSSSTASP